MLALALGGAIGALSSARLALAEFLQEDPVRDPRLEALAAEPIVALALDPRGRPLAAGPGGLWREEPEGWRRLSGEPHAALVVDAGGRSLVARAERIVEVLEDGGEREVLRHAPGEIRGFALDGEGRFTVIGPRLHEEGDSRRGMRAAPRSNTLFYDAGGRPIEPAGVPSRIYAWSVASAPDGRFWIAAREGLFFGTGARLERVPPPTDRLWILGEVSEGLRVLRDGVVVWGNDTGLGRYDPSTGSFTGWRPDTDGVPFPYANAIAGGTEGELWIGGRIGAARRRPTGAWTYHQGRAWLPHDNVLSILIDAPRGRVLLGTARGLGALEQRPMTLARKAAHLDRLASTHHTSRQGVVWDVPLRIPGDIATAGEAGYSDNDGLWTAAYVGAQALRFAATGEDEARVSARRSMEAILTLETVTGIPGYPARSFVLAALHPDAERFSTWNRTADGRYFWLGDTSSDETVGHYFAHALYHDLVATEDEKPRLRALVAEMTDHILRNGLTLVERDDGEPTRWGVWSPERCWEWGHYHYSSGLWSLCILSHLKVAHHITGDARYDEVYRHLIGDHDYARRTLRQKVTFGHINHSDDQMAILSYYPLLLYERDPELRAIYKESLEASWRIERPEASPLWNFVHNWAFESREDLERSRAHLELAPWLLVTWSHDNTRRWDLPLAPLLAGRARSARALSLAEGGLYYFTNNPYELQSGDGGHTLRSPSLYLLPYWLGRRHGLLGEGE